MSCTSGAAHGATDTGPNGGDQASGLTGLTCSPGRTYPHSRHAVCGRLAPPQFGHSVVWTRSSASWARRRRVRPGDWRNAGTGIGWNPDEGCDQNGWTGPAKNPSANRVRYGSLGILSRNQVVSDPRARECLMSSTTAFTLHTDGGCSPNPGPGGWGFVLDTPGGDRLERFGGEQVPRLHPDLRSRTWGLRTCFLLTHV